MGAGHFGHQPPKKTSGEHRMPCVFDESCSDSSYGTLTVNLNDMAKRIYCHACGVRGNLLTLLWGLAKQQAPTGGKLRGEEFKEAVGLLRDISGGAAPASEPTKEAASPPAGLYVVRPFGALLG